MVELDANYFLSQPFGQMEIDIELVYRCLQDIDPSRGVLGGEVLVSWGSAPQCYWGTTHFGVKSVLSTSHLLSAMKICLQPVAPAQTNPTRRRLRVIPTQRFPYTHAESEHGGLRETRSASLLPSCPPAALLKRVYPLLLRRAMSVGSEGGFLIPTSRHPHRR